MLKYIFKIQKKFHAEPVSIYFLKFLKKISKIPEAIAGFLISLRCLPILLCRESPLAIAVEDVHRL